MHYAVTADEARAKVLEICRKANAKLVTKGKSMIGEEIAINDFLEANGIAPVETDLGEYLVQIRHELPSHIIMPAVHLTQEQIEADFRRVHTHLPADRQLVEPQTLLTEARVILRDRFLAADVGITGANFLIAETGTSIIVTNEGNGDLTQTLPRVHIVLASIEKVVPTLEDVSQFLRVLARSATAQEMSVYTTFSTGPRRDGDPDGPNEYHVIILDNGRTAMLGGQFREMLRCIRCGACMNHCPVYAAVGGHTYGWVYPGPMGAVLTPSIVGIENAGHLPNASTFCGRCEEVCPVRIPLPKLMRHWREREFERHLSPATVRTGLAAWGFLATRPRLYAVAMSLFVFCAGADRKALRPLPLAAARRRLDAASRFSRARGADVPGAVEAAGADAMTARATLFASIRQSLGVTGDEPARRAAVADRLKQHPRGVIPARGQLAARGARQTVRRDGRGRGRHRRDAARAPPTCPPPSRRCCAGITCRCRSAAATIRGSPRCRGTGSARSRFRPAPPTAISSSR